MMVTIILRPEIYVQWKLLVSLGVLVNNNEQKKSWVCPVSLFFFLYINNNVMMKIPIYKVTSVDKVMNLK